MPYSPTHPGIYAAAFSGAFSGIEAANRRPTSTTPSNYETACSIADAFAQRFDALYAGTDGEQDEMLASQLSLALFLERYPTSVVPSYYSATVQVILAMMIQANTHLTNVPDGSQGAQGAQGAQGNQSSVQGEQGNQGNQGFQGEQGNQGTQGDQGFQGTP
jgi:hypothetical protein